MTKLEKLQMDFHAGLKMYNEANEKVKVLTDEKNKQLHEDLCLLEYSLTRHGLINRLIEKMSSILDKYFFEDVFTCVEYMHEPLIELLKKGIEYNGLQKIGICAYEWENDSIAYVIRDINRLLSSDYKVGLFGDKIEEDDREKYIAHNYARCRVMLDELCENVGIMKVILHDNELMGNDFKDMLNLKISEEQECTSSKLFKKELKSFYNIEEMTPTHWITGTLRLKNKEI